MATKQTVLYTVREVDGLATINETPGLYNWQAVERIEAVEPGLDAKAVVADAAATGCGTGEGIIVLASTV